MKKLQLLALFAFTLSATAQDKPRVFVQGEGIGKCQQQR